jgi:hypothetical protein
MLQRGLSITLRGAANIFLIAIIRTPTRARLSIIIIKVRVLALFLILLDSVVSVFATLLAVLLELWCLRDIQDLHSISHVSRFLFNDSKPDVAQFELCQVCISHNNYTCNLLVRLRKAFY